MRHCESTVNTPSLIESSIVLSLPSKSLGISISHHNYCILQAIYIIVHAFCNKDQCRIREPALRAQAVGIKDQASTM